MLKKHINIVLLVSIILICFFFLELFVRFLGTHEIDGNFEFRNIRLKPYQLPTKRIENILKNHLTSTNTIGVYDSILGWSPKPGRKGDLYSYNSLGIRSAPTEYSISPSKDVLRICIFGDSFTHGDEVVFEKTWGNYLERNLKKIDFNSEVINFGFGGYGIDQAFLRWREIGARFSPDLVILGFQGENVKRNVNIFRAIYMKHTASPFSKPRFIMENDSLRLINSPTVPILKIVDTMKNFGEWELSKYEYFFNPNDYQTVFWKKSRLLSFIYSEVNKIAQPEDKKPFYSIEKEPALLTLKIIQEFKKSAEKNGGRFMIVHLPIQSDILNLLHGKELVYSELLQKIEKSSDIVFPELEMVEAAKISSVDSLFGITHYSDEANKIVGDVLAKYIFSHIDGTGIE
ncbi:SGNH/GDSL hydrolase family protein [candidate division KSB1 bacterium]|nr:SGNH/GDSL hydrolase family protein [candidate division KSB1 bacterium]MBL7092858.1 SGNH/GDSL hydrolase family protein [candidate division KSB1 bacterium]